MGSAPPAGGYAKPPLSAAGGHLSCTARLARAAAFCARVHLEISGSLINLANAWTTEMDSLAYVACRRICYCGPDVLRPAMRVCGWRSSCRRRGPTEGARHEALFEKRSGAAINVGLPKMFSKDRFRVGARNCTGAVKSVLLQTLRRSGYRPAKSGEEQTQISPYYLFIGPIKLRTGP